MISDLSEHIRLLPEHLSNLWCPLLLRGTIRVH